MSGEATVREGRQVGETADVGWEIGARATLPVALPEAWELVSSRLDLWLGEGPVDLTRGAGYEVAAGDGTLAARGEIRSVRRDDRIRMTWWPDGWDAPATLQVALLDRGGERTAVGFHMEHLADGDVRERMRAHLKAALARLEAAVDGAGT